MTLFVAKSPMPSQVWRLSAASTSARVGGLEPLRVQVIAEAQAAKLSQRSSRPAELGAAEPPPSARAAIHRRQQRRHEAVARAHGVDDLDTRRPNRDPVPGPAWQSAPRSPSVATQKRGPASPRRQGSPRGSGRGRAIEGPLRSPSRLSLRSLAFDERCVRLPVGVTKGRMLGS